MQRTVQCLRHVNMFSWPDRFDGIVEHIPTMINRYQITCLTRRGGHQVGIKHLVVFLNKCDMVDDEDLMEVLQHWFSC
eukprot:SAG11_NODE_98_length_16927_cov_35.166211_18_plen_78_part_00